MPLSSSLPFAHSHHATILMGGEGEKEGRKRSLLFPQNPWLKEPQDDRIKYGDLDDDL